MGHLIHTKQSHIFKKSVKFDYEEKKQQQTNHDYFFTDVYDFSTFQFMWEISLI